MVGLVRPSTGRLGAWVSNAQAEESATRCWRSDAQRHCIESIGQAAGVVGVAAGDGGAAGVPVEELGAGFGEQPGGCLSRPAVALFKAVSNRASTSG
jgi:hypothetical protein